MSLQKLKHVILTRFNLGLYDSATAEEWMAQRWPLFVRTRESVLNQEGDFEWRISVDRRTPGVWLGRMANDKRIRLSLDHPKEFRSEGWTITTRLDNDDLLFPGAVKAIQDAFEPRTLVVDLKYYQLYGGKLYTSGRNEDNWERPNPNSPFLSLIEHGAKKTCYARPHSKMIEDFDSKFASNDVYACMVVHENNLGNSVVGREVNMDSLPDYIKNNI